MFTNMLFINKTLHLNILSNINLLVLSLRSFCHNELQSHSIQLELIKAKYKTSKTSVFLLVVKILEGEKANEALLFCTNLNSACPFRVSK